MDDIFSNSTHPPRNYSRQESDDFTFETTSLAAVMRQDVPLMLIPQSSANERNGSLSSSSRFAMAMAMAISSPDSSNRTLSSHALEADEISGLSLDDRKREGGAVAVPVNSSNWFGTTEEYNHIHHTPSSVPRSSSYDTHQKKSSDDDSNNHDEIEGQSHNNKVLLHKDVMELQEQIRDVIMEDNRLYQESIDLCNKLANRDAHQFKASDNRKEYNPKKLSNPIDLCVSDLVSVDSACGWSDLDQNRINLDVLVAIQNQEMIRLHIQRDREHERESVTLAEKLALQDMELERLSGRRSDAFPYSYSR